MTAKNLWFTGTGPFAALCLSRLAKSGLPLSRVITGLPTRSGRNNRENPSPVEITASSLGLNATRTARLSDNLPLLDALESESPAAIFVIDFGQIIREPFLSRLCLNIHPSLLPEYRGAAPIQRALLDGKTKTGVTLFRLAKAMDAGPIVAQEPLAISPSDNASDLYEKLSAIGCELALKAVRNLDALSFTPQDDGLATFAPKLEKQDFQLSFTMTAETFASKVRALDMSGGAYITVNNKRVKVWRAAVRTDIKAEAPGQVQEASGCPVISCGDSCVELREVQSEGKNKITGSEWARGMRLQAGDNLRKV